LVEAGRLVGSNERVEPVEESISHQT